MRLLDVHTLKLETFTSLLPQYAIASHRWSDAETSFEDVRAGLMVKSPGYRKIEQFAALVRKYRINYLWIDTCCINRNNASELSDAIGNMYKWYEGSAVCLAQLSDVQKVDQLRKSAWFTRGWTLLELLAPGLVIFISSDWTVLGHKLQNGSRSGLVDHIGPRLNSEVSRITGIPEIIIDESEERQKLNEDQKREWMAQRKTTLPEDMAYCLLGLLDVFILPEYGEGQARAEFRLNEAIAKRLHDRDQDHEMEVFRRKLYTHAQPYLGGKDKNVEKMPGICEWVENHHKFKDWELPEHRGRSPSLMLVTEGNRCEKSVLAQYLVDYVLPKDGRKVCHAFFGQESEVRKHSPGAVCALLHRLLCSNPRFPQDNESHIPRAYIRHGDDYFSDFEALWSTFEDVAKHQETVCVFDALEMCDDNGRKDLFNVFKLQSPSLRFMVTIQSDTPMDWYQLFTRYRSSRRHMSRYMYRDRHMNSDSSTDSDSSTGSDVRSDTGSKRIIRKLFSKLSGNVVSVHVEGNEGNTLYTPDILRKMVTKGDYEQVQNLLEHNFDRAANNSYRWLHNLIEMGQSKAEIGRMLVDVHTRTPWIHLDYIRSHQFSLKPSVHQEGCIHEVRKRKLTARTNQDERSDTSIVDGAIEFKSRTDYKHDIASLCGLAGVVPLSRDMDNWDGTVNFVTEEKSSTAKVSYALEDSTRNSDSFVRARLYQICERLESAVGLLQSKKLCCDSYTIVCWRGERVELCKIPVSDILHLKTALDYTTPNDEATRLLAESSSRVVHIVAGLEATDHTRTPALDMGVLADVLHNTALALQILCLGFLSYSQAHVGEIQPFFLQYAVNHLILQGIRRDEHVEAQIDVKFVMLTCLGDLLKQPVLVFGEKAERDQMSDLSTPVDIRASAENIIDLLGMGLLNTTPNHLLQDEVHSVTIGGGLLIRPHAERDILHWSKQKDFSSEKYPSLEFPAFSLKRIYDIGMIDYNIDMIDCNTLCNLKLPRSRTTFWNKSESYLENIFTQPPGMRLTAGTIQGSFARGIGIQVNTHFASIPGVTLKDRILAVFNNPTRYWPLDYLHGNFGLQVSLCTRIAQRVPIRVLLADVMPAYVASLNPVPPNWKEYGTELTDELRNGQFTNLLSDAHDHANYAEYRQLINDVLHSLRNTGVNGGGAFILGTPTRSEQGFRLSCNATNSWAWVLRDTESCATFAYVTIDCLQYGPVSCRYRDGHAWRDEVQMLKTEVLQTRNTGEPYLIPETRHRFGAPGSGLIAIVKKGLLLNTVKLLIKYHPLSEISDAIRIWRDQEPVQYVRERGSLTGGIQGVTVHSSEQ